MGDLASLVKDPEFVSLPLADQRAALVHATGDNEFSTLSDADTQKFLNVARNSQPTKFEQERTGPKEGFWTAAGKDVVGAAEGLANMAGKTPVGMAVEAGVRSGGNEIAREQEGRSLPYRILAGVGENVAPLNVRGVEEAANVGDTSGVLGHAATGTALAVAPAAIEKVAPKNSASEFFANRTTKAVRTALPTETAGLPPQAVRGAEQVFRGVAPVGSFTDARANLYTAAGDLAEIGQKVDWQGTKGGALQPDMRPRAVVNATNEHLQQMYQTERAPQIARHADNPVLTNYGADATDGLQYLANKAGNSELRNLANKALTNEHLTLAETDQLARLTNKELRSYESLDAPDKAALEATNPKIGGLKALDREFSNRIATELSNRGEPGIREYEKRFATLSSLRDQLQSRLNAIELQRSTTAGRLVKSALQGVKGVASASQAAIADVNIGNSLENGFRNLAQSGIKPNRGLPTATSPVKGLLPSHPIELPSNLEPLTPAGPPAINIEPTTAAQRLGRLLPERTGGRMVTPVPGAMDFTPPVRGLALPTAEQAFNFLRRAGGNRQLAQQLAAQEGFRLR